MTTGVQHRRRPGGEDNNNGRRRGRQLGEDGNGRDNDKRGGSGHQRQQQRQDDDNEWDQEKTMQKMTAMTRGDGNGDGKQHPPRPCEQRLAEGIMGGNDHEKREGGGTTT
jgi:hypothetical protein